MCAIGRIPRTTKRGEKQKEAELDIIRATYTVSTCPILHPFFISEKIDQRYPLRPNDVDLKSDHVT